MSSSKFLKIDKNTQNHRFFPILTPLLSLIINVTYQIIEQNIINFITGENKDFEFFCIVIKM